MELESCSNSPETASVLVEIKKKNSSVWIWDSLGGTSLMGLFLRFFGHIYAALRANPISHFGGSSLCWKLG